MKLGIENLKEYKGCLVIAEVAQAHDGSLGMAHSYIDAIAEAGADAVKFQTHIADAESTMDEPWRVKFSLQDRTRYDYWRRMEFTEEQWRGLAEHTREKGLLFMSSPFSMEAVDLLERLDMQMWKVGSGEIGNRPMIEKMTKTKKPVLLSTGMCTLEELDCSVEWVKKAGCDLFILQCTSCYPCPPEEVGLNLLPYFQGRYQCKVGLSDHSGTIYPGILAAAMGASVVEVHVVFSRQMFGPDVSSSLTIEELAELKRGIRFVEQIISNPVDKTQMAQKFSDLRNTFFKSVIAERDLLKDTILDSTMLVAKKAGGGGIQISQMSQLLGKKLIRDIKKDEKITEEDIKA